VAWSTALCFNDPLSFQAAISTADLELLPTARGQFRAELTRVCMNQLWVQRCYQNLPLMIAGAMKPRRRVFTFLTSAEPEAMRHCGMDVVSGDIIVNTFDEIHQQLEPEFRLGSISLTTDDFDAACNAIVGHEFPGDKLKLVVRPNPELMSRLTELHRTVGQIAKTTPAILELPQVSRALEQQLVHLIVRCVTEGAPLKIPLGGRNHDMIVARFEAFLEANPNTPLYLPELRASTLKQTVFSLTPRPRPLGFGMSFNCLPSLWSQLRLRPAPSPLWLPKNLNYFLPADRHRWNRIVQHHS